MAVTRQDVLHIAELARLGVDGARADELSDLRANQQLLQQKKNQAITTWFNNLSKSFCKGGKIHYQVGYTPSPDPCTSTTSTNTST